MKKTLKGNYQNIFLVIVLGTYIFASSLNDLFGLHSIAFSVVQRLIVCLFSIIIIVFNFSNLNSNKKYIFFIMAFWLFFLVKSYYSFNHYQYDLDFSRYFNEYYVRIIINCMIPTLAILLLDFKKVKFDWVIRWIYGILFIMLTVNLLSGFTINHFGISSGIFNVYYITYGHFGTSLVILSSYFLLFRKNKLPDQLIFVIGALLGVVTLINSSARSPLLALLVIFVYLGILYKKKNVLYVVILGIIAFIVIIFMLYHCGYSFESAFVKRTYSAIFEGNNSNRSPLFTKAIEIFSQNPIFGGRVFYKDGMYPHNLFLEILMTTGVIGTTLYAFYYLPLIKNLKYFFVYNTEKLFLLPFFILFLQYFILSLTSYSLIGNLEFCYYSAFIISISYIVEKEEKD